MKVSIPKGKERTFNGVLGGLRNLTDELTGGTRSFSNDITSRIRDYQIQNPELNLNGSIQRIAKDYGLENELDTYIKGKVIRSINGRAAYALDLLTSFKDSFEDLEEMVEGAATIAAGIPTAGAGSVVVQIGSKIIKVPTYIAIQTVYSALAGLLGYASETYSPTKKGIGKYFTDVAMGYVGVIGSAVPLLGSVLELGTNLDDKRPRIAEAAAQRTGAWLLNRVREKKNLTVVEEEPVWGLEGLIRSGKGRFKGNKPAPLADYGSVSKLPLYGADVTANRAYSPIAA